jgi:hypothetical protein
MSGENSVRDCRVGTEWERTEMVVAWREQGPQTATGPLWEVAVERESQSEPWSVYSHFQAQTDGHVDVIEMQRCVSACYAAELEQMRLDDPERWMRGQVSARYPDICGKNRRLDEFIANHTALCQTAGCTLFGRLHLVADDAGVQHTALHMSGPGWELEVATLPGTEEWRIWGLGGRPLPTDAHQDFATGMHFAESRVRQLNAQRQHGGEAQR